METADVAERFDEIEQEKRSRERDEKRARVTRTFLRDLAELDGNEDGVYLHEIFDLIGDEVQILMMKDSECVRELSFILSKCDEATGWARKIGEKKMHLYVLDRRRFSDD